MDEKQLRQGEINLMDLLLYCLEKWRWIVASMLIVAILMGAYKYQASVKANQYENQSGQEKIDESTIENTEEEKSKNEERTIKSYEQAIEELERDLEIKEDYLKNSVVMQMEPNHITTGTLSYYVEDGEYKSGILAAYNAFVSGGGLAEELFELDQNVPVEDLRYLISFSNSKTDAFRFDSSAQTMFSLEAGVPVFQIQIRMPDSELGKIYLKYAEDIIAKYTIQLQSEIEDYKIFLLSSTQSEMIDSEIQEYQSTMRTDYATSVKNLQVLRTEFEAIQNPQQDTQQNPQQDTQQNPQQDTQQNTQTITHPTALSSAMEFAMLGLILGAGLACLVLITLYWLGGKLKNIDGFNVEYGMPLLGVVRVSGIKKRLLGFIDSWVFRLRRGIYAKISFEEQIKMTMVNVQLAINSTEGELYKIMLAGTIAEKDAEELYVHLTSEIQTVSFSTYKQMIFQSSALRELEDYDGILFLEKKDASSSELIIQEKKLASDRNVKVLGTIVLC